MRTTLIVSLLLTSLLTACASKSDPVNKHISQSGTLKVHPDLLRAPATSDAANAK